jgi:hypothetical protein
MRHSCRQEVNCLKQVVMSVRVDGGLGVGVELAADELVDDTKQILDSLHAGEERLEIGVPPLYTLGAPHAEGNGV